MLAAASSPTSKKMEDDLFSEPLIQMPGTAIRCIWEPLIWKAIPNVEGRFSLRLHGTTIQCRGQDAKP
ncbi:MAG: hypothetical protein EBU26_02080 [Verrucomicrobia bacterium]|nr:hypothetical protein [Verrucomicrobiota bacterium]